jgi:hypothetical protein
MIDNIVIYAIAYYLRFIDYLCNVDLFRLRKLWCSFFIKKYLKNKVL